MDKTLIPKNHARVVPSQTLDGDLHLRHQHQLSEPLVKRRGQKYFAFLLADLPSISHDGLAFSSEKLPKFNIEIFLSAISNLSRFLSREFGIPATYLGHAKQEGRETELETLYGLAPIYVGKTWQIIKNAEFVVTYLSTAISFCVLNRKPTVLYHLESFGPGHLADCKQMSRELGLSVLRPSITTRVPKLSNIDRVKYERYLDKYVRHPNSPGIPWVQQVVEILGR
jgi:hypothetical protein